MKKIFLLLAAVLILAGCAYYRPVAISQPPPAGSDISVIPRSSDPLVWRSDATRVVFVNNSLSIHVEIWLDREYDGLPDLWLQPEQASPANFDGVGERVIYLRAYETTRNGWKKIGEAKRTVRIFRYFYGYTQEISVGDYDFAH